MPVSEICCFFVLCPPNVQHCTWLGFRPRAAGGGRRARAETPGRVGEPRREPGFSFCACTDDMLFFRVVPGQRATLYLVRFPPARRQWRKESAGGNARESRELSRKTGLFSLPSGKSSSEPTPPNVQHCTWLGFHPRAASGGRRARAETPGRVGKRRRKTGLFHFQSDNDLFGLIPQPTCNIVLG